MIGLGVGMSLDIASLFAEREADRYALHTRYLNEQMVRVLQDDRLSTSASAAGTANISTTATSGDISTC